MIWRSRPSRFVLRSGRCFLHVSHTSSRPWHHHIHVSDCQTPMSSPSSDAELSELSPVERTGTDGTGEECKKRNALSSSTSANGYSGTK